MGCDIHMWVEKYDKYESKKWKMICDSAASYRNRNYTTFAVLAGVRAQTDEAGEPLIKPIAEPRGAPKGLSPQVKKEIEAWSGDIHSVSWLTLAEIRAYDWKGGAQTTGLIDPVTAFELFEKNKVPATYCQGTSEKIVTSEEMSKLIRKHHVYLEQMAEKTKPNDRIFLNLNERDLRVRSRATWKTDLTDDCSDFLGWIESMERVAYWDQYKDDIRLVFGFDN